MKNKLLLTPKDFKPSFEDWEIKGVLNPAAVRLPNKKIMLFARIAEAEKGDRDKTHSPVIITEKEYLSLPESANKKTCLNSTGKAIHFKDGPHKIPTLSHFRKVLLDKSGFKVEKISQTPDFTGRPAGSNYGVEDPRITKIGKEYYMTYVSPSTRNGISVSLSTSKDLIEWQRKGIIFQEQNKDVMLFPEKINHKYVALNRPETSFFSRPTIWISFSKNLIYWGKPKRLFRTRRNSWDANRIGGGTPPIKTKQGWLMIYHGIHKKRGKTIYSAGVVLLDIKDPTKLIARTPTNKPLFTPTKPYEKVGFLKNVVFPTGLIRALNHKDILIYSGGADTVIDVKKISLDEVFKSLEYY